MSKHRIAVLPGDGIGPEVMQEAEQVLSLLGEVDPTFQCDVTAFHWNSDYYLEHNRMMPEDGLERLKAFDAILFGAIGDSRVPDHVTVWELIMPIRKKFDQYINYRPVKQLKGIRTPFKDMNQMIDFSIIRENAEGEYSNSGGRLYEGTDRELAIQNTVMTREGIKKVSQFTFEYARSKGLKKVTSATKSNAVIHSMNFWDEVVNEVSSDYPDIEMERIYIDALAAFFVQKPQAFEVVVASNLFGDILSDLGSAVVGGLGVSPSANINPSRDYPSMFEPVHGSAPDIKGKGIANPVAQIWSAALMVEHLGRSDLHTSILQAIEDSIAAGVTTPDLGGKSSTKEVGSAIRNHLKIRIREGHTNAATP
ncbi:tartrate dehydrogenase/decarboxylase/D-malate dehydrogenase [Bacillus pakistanensis]|uniref:D-malate dehydrogenase (decarboxylating) n=1 Tax=Rossellomorea pakistanensis TaxID=992288 RepID=A0ABS2N9E0_9BACI|nr:tartrate dehydrogenase [Bacillus pakistanensis]MBM7584478.1 tartrate dehydrogenase/decarboxylase/D-malate dehydrogenase [Bacillus pakistanensis]